MPATPKLPKCLGLQFHRWWRQNGRLMATRPSKQSRSALVRFYFGFGVLFYSRIEGWNVSTSLYFLMVTASTVGYGDLYPGAGKDDEWKAQYLAGSRAFSLIYLFLGVVVVFAQASALLAHKFRPLFRISRNAIERAFPQKGIDIDNDGTFDFKVPRSPPYYYGKHLLGPIPSSWLCRSLVRSSSCWSSPVWTWYGDVSLPCHSYDSWLR